MYDAAVNGSLCRRLKLTISMQNCEACAAVVKDAPRNVAAGIVRPRLSSGDALIFDARILHFGLPNRSTKRRAIVYCNHTEYWFRDPKNWDDRVSVFDDS